MDIERWNRRRIVTLGACALIAALGLMGLESFLRPDLPQSVARPGEEYGLHEEARDGDIVFTVTSAACGRDVFPGAQGSGKYCAFDLMVQNVGETPLSVAPEWQNAFIGTKEVPNDNDKFVDFFQEFAFPRHGLNAELAAGEKLPSILFFRNVPQDGHPDELILRSSETSNGVKVKIEDCDYGGC